MLFVIWIGANDYVNGPTDVEDITSKVVDTIKKDVEYLIDHHGSMFLIMNLPDLGKTPKARKAHNERLLTDLSQRHNQKLHQAFLALKQAHPEVHWAYFDMFGAMSELMENPVAYGIRNTDNACYTDGYLRRELATQAVSPDKHTLQEYLLTEARNNSDAVDLDKLNDLLDNPSLHEAITTAYLQSRHPNLLNSLDCSGYLFWDYLHPTTQGHAIIADKVADTLSMADLYPQ